MSRILLSVLVFSTMQSPLPLWGGPAGTAEAGVSVTPAIEAAEVPREELPAVDPEVMKSGRIQFIVCAACHGQSGEGTGAGPPLAGSEWVLGPVENLIRIQLRGLRGPITVKGVEYDFPAGMAALAYQNDAQIAAVITYMRNSFGNRASPVTPEQVAALRGEVGKPPLTVADLIPPPGIVITEGTPATGSSGAYDDLEAPSSLPKWIALGAILALACGAGWWMKRGS
jgi:mono/diheme cytochrome c family protein